MILSHIVATARNGVIGSGNKIPWNVPEDLQFFKETTTGSPMIMGRKTFESLPGVLPGRNHIVISRNAREMEKSVTSEQQAKIQSRKATVDFVENIEDAIAIAEKYLGANRDGNIFIAGGAEIYKQTLSIVNKVYLTKIDVSISGDAFYEPDLSDFTLVETRMLSSSPRAELQIWQRI